MGSSLLSGGLATFQILGPNLHVPIAPEDQRHINVSLQLAPYDKSKGLLTHSIQPPLQILF